MNRNTQLLLAVSAVFGLGAGAYEFLLPYYLAQRGVPFRGMALIFALPTVGVLLLRVYLGGLSDVWGRKVFYSAALVASALATWTTALVGSVLPLTLLKTMREAAVLTREVIHPVVLWEDNRARFLDFIGKTRGAEYLFMGLGTILAGWAAERLGNPFGLRLAGTMLLASAVLFVGGFREGRRWVRQRERPRGRLLSLKMERNLLLIAGSGFVFAAGLSTSHCFVMPLFFTEKFGVSVGAVAWVMFLHRLTTGLPMLLIGQLRLSNLKATYIATVIAEGVALAGSVLAPGFLSSAGIWLLHDLIGAGIWVPIQHAIIQRYSKDATRGLEVSKVMTMSGLGGVIGPIIAGGVFGRNVNAPFFISGLMMIVAAGPLFFLRLERFSEVESAALGVEQ